MVLFLIFYIHLIHSFLVIPPSNPIKHIPLANEPSFIHNISLTINNWMLLFIRIKPRILIKFQHRQPPRSTPPQISPETSPLSCAGMVQAITIQKRKPKNAAKAELSISTRELRYKRSVNRDMNFVIIKVTYKLLICI